jgi:hypothetical protein
MPLVERYLWHHSGPACNPNAREQDDEQEDELPSTRGNSICISTQAHDVTPKRTKTVSVAVPQTSGSADWGLALNVVNPDFTPRLEPKNPIIKKALHQKQCHTALRDQCLNLHGKGVHPKKRHSPRLQPLYPRFVRVRRRDMLHLEMLHCRYAPRMSCGRPG